MASLVRNRGLAEYFDRVARVPAINVIEPANTGLLIANWEGEIGSPVCRRNVTLSIKYNCEGDCDEGVLRVNQLRGQGQTGDVTNIELRDNDRKEISFEFGNFMRMSMFANRRSSGDSFADRNIISTADIYVDEILIDRIYFWVQPTSGRSFSTDEFVELLKDEPEVSRSALVDIPGDDGRLGQGVFRPIDLPQVGQGNTLATFNHGAIAAYDSYKFYVSNRQFVFNSNTGQIATNNRPGSQWMGEFTLPPLNERQYREWSAFIDRLHGQAGTFIVSDPDRPQPLGSMALVPGQPEAPIRPVIDDVLDNQTISIAVSRPIPDTLDTQYWTLEDNYLEVGDYINLTMANGVTFLHKITRIALATERTRLICGIVPAMQIFNIQPDQFTLHLNKPATAARLLVSNPSFTRATDGLWNFRLRWVESVGDYTRTE